MSNKVLHVIPEVSMIYGHKGLSEAAAKARLGIKPEELKQGEFIMFINKAFTAVKLLAANEVLIYYRHPKRHRLNYEALRLIPNFFDGRSLNYPKALRALIDKKYPELARLQTRAPAPKEASP